MPYPQASLGGCTRPRAAGESLRRRLPFAPCLVQATADGGRRLPPVADVSEGRTPSLPGTGSPHPDIPGDDVDQSLFSFPL